MHYIRYLLIAFCCIAFAAPHVATAQADRDMPVNVESDRLTADDAKQLAIFEGRVVLTQGTFVLRADKLVVRKDEQGFQHATAYGSPATFRQRREGTNELIEGEAIRIEYDGKREFIELHDKARLSREKDQVQGSYISYDVRKDFFTVKGGKTETSTAQSDTRVRAVIQPKPKSDGNKPSAPARLQSTPALEGGTP